MTQTCATCRFFAAIIANPDPNTQGACRRYPKEREPIRPTYWCGEWRAKMDSVGGIEVKP